MPQTVTLQLPEETLRRYQRGAKAAHKVLEEFLIERLADIAPPLVETLPSPLREELKDLETLDNPALMEVAQSRLPLARQRVYSRLLRKNGQATLSVHERNKLYELGEETRRLTLKKAHAYMLLKWRGHAIPSPEAQQPR